MRELKDGIRSQVRVSYDDKVYKTFRGTDADKRFANEVKVLQYLEKRGCVYVPRLLGFDEEKLMIITTNCGQSVDKISKEKMEYLYKNLEEKYGVRHDDQAMRNITYSHKINRFCVIDFELAEILEK